MEDKHAPSPGCLGMVHPSSTAHSSQGLERSLCRREVKAPLLETHVGRNRPTSELMWHVSEIFKDGN